MFKSLLVTILPAALALILSGCGPSTGPSSSIQVIMTDFAFTPNTLTVPAGKQINIRVTNNGAVGHDLMIMKMGHEVTSQDHVGAETHAFAFWEEEQLGAGETRESTFTAPSQPGAYQIICGVPGHLEAGMVGKLVVVSAP